MLVFISSTTRVLGASPYSRVRSADATCKSVLIPIIKTTLIYSIFRVSDELDEVVQARTTPEDALSSAPEVLAMLSKQTETFEELERVTKEIIMMQKFRIALLEDALQKNGIESPRGKDVKLPFR